MHSKYPGWRRGDVFFGDIPTPETTHLQSGVRPWVVIQNNTGNKHSPTTIVAPLTSQQKKDMPTHVWVYPSWLSRPSTVLLEQIRAVDISRSWRYAGTLNDEDMRRIDKAIKISLEVV